MIVARLRANAKRVRLKNMQPGLFLSQHGELCVRTEYGLESYIVRSGEAFVGGVPKAELGDVLVTPVRIVEP